MSTLFFLQFKNELIFSKAKSNAELAEQINTFEIIIFQFNSRANEANLQKLNKDLVSSHVKEKETFQTQIVIFIQIYFL